jgi:hypothetical protein
LRLLQPQIEPGEKVMCVAFGDAAPVQVRESELSLRYRFIQVVFGRELLSARKMRRSIFRRFLQDDSHNSMSFLVTMIALEDL